MKHRQNTDSTSHARPAIAVAMGFVFTAAFLGFTAMLAAVTLA